MVLFQNGYQSWSERFLELLRHSLLKKYEELEKEEEEEEEEGEEGGYSTATCQCMSDVARNTLQFLHKLSEIQVRKRERLHVHVHNYID